MAPAAAVRLPRLARLDDDELAALNAIRPCRRIAAHREIVAEGTPVSEPMVVVSGWVGRTRLFADGRRQILNLLLPGDLFGFSRHVQPRAMTTIMALTEAQIGVAPPASTDSGLAKAYAIATASEQLCLFRQIGRLGQLSAYERLADFLLETYDRLAMSDQAAGGTMPMPLTQEALGDLLGLTSVHINRTLQAMRHDGLLDLRSGMARLRDIARLRRLVDVRDAVVSIA